MTIIASALFLLALAASIFVIVGNVADHMPRILDVIENRDGAALPSRKITVGPLRTTSKKSQAAPLRLRLANAPVLRKLPPTIARPASYGWHPSKIAA
ncbi:MAG: hypothetical protein HC843_06655 [Sphingomonadales bacterium]|nr:hypothetical protein [Sphingomonadales bacterium]